jgi:hypothetical protein
MQSLFIAACILSALIGQGPDSPSQALVEGLVTNKLTGAPVRSAHVIYMQLGTGAGAPASPISTDTDAEGHFRILLAPGTYRLWAERNGFARQMYGALSPAGEGTAVTLAPGQQLHQVTFRAVPLGAIAGHVFDDDAEPVQGVGVQALRFSYAGGRRQLISVAGASSNDRGEFRVFGLPAGHYLLLASIPNSPMSRPFDTDGLVPEVQEPYAAVYYPGVLDVDSASRISLTEGGDLGDVDFHLHKVRAATVRGRLVGPADKLSASQVQVVLAHNESNAASYIGRASAFVDSATGKFEIRGVSPGSYLLVASQLFAGRPLGGRAPVEVSVTAPREEVAVALAPAFDIVGNVEVEGAPRGSVPTLLIRLAPSEGLALGPQPWSKVGADGSFRLSGVTPGLWTLVLDSLPEGLWVKSESYAGNEVPSGELAVHEAARGQLRIVLAGNGARISGTVTAEGQPAAATIVLAPASPELRPFHQLYRVTNATERGMFTLKDVRPGSYKLFAFREVEPFAWFDPEQLNAAEAMGVPITVSEGENALRDVLAIPPDALLPR